MCPIDELDLKLPFTGARMLRDLLGLEGLKLSRKHVTTLMRRMGIEEIYRRKNSSRPHPENAVFPYLLRRRSIDRPNQVWAADVTYIPMARDFVYLVAVIDWFTRNVLSWRLSNTLTADFCVDALRDALARFGRSETFSTEKGAQFTSAEFIATVKTHQVRISMDGYGRRRDNALVERLWRSIKYEAVYFHANNTVSEARSDLARFIDFFKPDDRIPLWTGARPMPCT